MVELATDKHRCPARRLVYEYFGRPAPPSIFDRFYLVISLAELGRFDESAEAIRLTEPMHQQHWNSVGLAYFTHLALDRLLIFHVVAGRRQALPQPGNWLACFTQPAS